MKNHSIDDKDIIQYRFAAYLKKSIVHKKTRYLNKVLEDHRRESFCLETLERLDSQENTYLSDELEDELLCRALTRLREHERTIVFRRAVSEESFIKIAADMGLKYVTVKAIYRRSLEKLRKEMRKK